MVKRFCSDIVKGTFLSRLFSVCTLALVTLSLGVTLAAYHSAAPKSCPGASEKDGDECVLDEDATLDATWELKSGTHLNCRGHRLTPTTAGAIDDPRTDPENEFTPSNPELALFVRDAYDVRIQNCVISGFDFGIIVAQSKSDGAPHGQTDNKILANTIDVRTNAIDIIKSDGVVVSNNFIKYASERGRGIVVDFDSDENTILGNTIVSSDAASTGQVRQLPGGPPVTGMAIMDNEIHVLQSDKPLQNFVVNGALVQIASLEPWSSDPDDASRSDHNVILLNSIRDDGAGATCSLDPGTSCTSNAGCGAGKGTCLLKANSGIGFNLRAAANLVSANSVSGQMDRGISMGGTNASDTQAAPGTCSLDARRLCVADGDCNAIPDFADVGICLGAEPVTLDGRSRENVAEYNVLAGTFETAALFANQTTSFEYRRNTVDGGSTGILLQASATNGTIERNIVANATNALQLVFQTPFSQTIRLNDFIGYTTAIRTSNNFTVLTDISADPGNYWGLPCPGFDPSKVLFASGLVNPSVFDGKPYGVPVALTPNASLPPRCQ